MVRTVYGVGINDSTYQVSVTENSKEVWRCPFYKQWKNMLARCYSPAYLKQDTKRERGSVDSRWWSFMAFREWMINQDWENKALDKDLLIKGNQHYSPETVLFVDRAINALICERRQETGIKGVYKNGSGWRAVVTQFDELGKSKQLSKTFRSKEEAHSAFVEMYKQSLTNYANIQIDEKVKQALLRKIEDPLD